MIKLYAFIVSLGLAFLTVFSSFNLEWFYMALLIVAFTFAYFIGCIAFFFIIWGFLVLTGKNNKNNRYSKYFRKVLNIMNYVCLSFFNVKKIYSGRELLKDLKGNFLLLTNHRSNFDSMVADSYLQKFKLQFVAKKSISKIPFVGHTVSGLGYFFLDRHDPAQQVEETMKVINQLKTTDVSIGIFPEGTRNSEIKEQLLPFKNGVFKIAYDSQKPVVISTIRYDSKISKFGWLKGHKVMYRILKVIPYEEYKDIPIKELSDNIRAIMEEDLKTNTF